MADALTRATDDYTLRHTSEGMWRIPKDEILDCCGNPENQGSVPMAHQRGLLHVASLYKIVSLDLARALLFAERAELRYIVAISKGEGRYADLDDESEIYILGIPKITSVPIDSKEGGFLTFTNIDEAVQDFLKYGTNSKKKNANPAHSRRSSGETELPKGYFVLEVIGCGFYFDMPHQGVNRRYFEEIYPFTVASIKEEDTSSFDDFK